MSVRGIVRWAAVFAAVASGNLEKSAWAEKDPRAILAGRQQIRAELVAAMADGALSTAERDAIDRQAKTVLPAEDLLALRRTLQRLAPSETGPIRPASRRPVAKKPVAAKSAAVDPAGPEQPTGKHLESPGEMRMMLSSFLLPEEKGVVRRTAFQQADEPQKLESPFREEVSMPEDGMAFEVSQDFACESREYERMRAMRNLSLCHVGFSAAVDAFKGPLDLDGRNGNFGLRLAVNGGLPLVTWAGIGLQAGTSAVLSDFHGTPFTDDAIRSQNFTTVGLFQRNALVEGLNWGFAYDWLFDQYYAGLTMGQWRVKIARELGPCHELGLWAAIPDRGDSAWIGSQAAGFTEDRFRPIAQGNLFYRRSWANDAQTTVWVGLADEPGQWVFGGEGRVPLSCRLALVGGFNYIQPSANGAAGRDEEIWNVSVGIEFVPGLRRGACAAPMFKPMLPLADNGIMAVGRY